MVALTRTYDPGEGPILNVTIAPRGSSNGQIFPLLLDTGADGSSVSSDVIAFLGLAPIGQRATIASGGSQGSLRTFIVDLAIQFDDGRWSQSDVVVAEFLYKKPSISGILGRDIICRGDFSMRADQTFSLRL